MQIPGLAGLSPLDLFTRAVKSFVHDDMITYAAALSYRILLALFPFIIFLFTLLGTLGLPDFFDWLLSQARIALPPVAFSLVEEVVGEIRGRASGGLLSASILFAIWAASTGVRSVMNALNRAYDVPESRPAWQRFPLSILFTFGLAILLIAATALMLLGPQAIQWLGERVGLSAFVTTLWTWLRWPLILLLLLLTLAIVYKVTPNIDQPFQVISPGSVISVVAWIAASFGFSYYVTNFANFGATYGSLGGIVVLLLYLFISSAVLLFGAEINATIYRAHRSNKCQQGHPG